MRGNFITDRSGSLNPNYKDGRKGTRLYRIWANIKTRCLNPNSTHYQYYGAKGITICDEWKDDFQSFYDWSMANGYSDELTIDRINNDFGYSPDNCRWATLKEQANNTSRCRMLTVNDETKTMCEWCEIYGMNYSLVRDRLNRHWTPEKALTTSPDIRFRKKEFIC